MKVTALAAYFLIGGQCLKNHDEVVLSTLQVSKYKSGSICKGLSYEEARCHCTHKECVSTLLSKKLIRSYEILRSWLDMPLYVTSLYRCPRHNADIGGAELSYHKKGEAIDFEVESVFNKIGKEKFLEIAKVSGFTYYVYYPSKKIIHLDVRDQGGNL